VWPICGDINRLVDHPLASSRPMSVAGINPYLTGLQVADAWRRPRLKAPEKIGAAAARILARDHGHCYYDWRYDDGTFRFFEHPIHFIREQVYEGKYVRN
jgi:hypothetical protein